MARAPAPRLRAVIVRRPLADAPVPTRSPRWKCCDGYRGERGVAEEGLDRRLEALGAVVAPVRLALAELLGEELEPDLIDGGLHGRELRQHLGRLGALLEHPLHPAQLPLGPAQPDHELLSGAGRARVAISGSRTRSRRRSIRLRRPQRARDGSGGRSRTR